jgi:hypothetical protein
VPARFPSKRPRILLRSKNKILILNGRATPGMCDPSTLAPRPFTSPRVGVPSRAHHTTREATDATPLHVTAHAFIWHVAKDGEPPCIGCRHNSKCRDQLLACVSFHSWVDGGGERERVPTRLEFKSVFP